MFFLKVFVMFPFKLIMDSNFKVFRVIKTTTKTIISHHNLSNKSNDNL